MNSLVDGHETRNVERLSGIGIPHFVANLAIGVVKLVIGLVRRYQNVGEFARQTVRQPILRVFDAAVKMPGRGQVVGVYLDPVLAFGLAIHICNYMGRTFSRVFIADKIAGNLLEDTGVEADGAEYRR